jgi:REP element-mobilizing transposase RayT
VSRNDHGKKGGVRPKSCGTGVPPVENEKHFRRNLPHFQTAGASYFLTWRCRPGITLSPGGRTITLNAIRHRHGLKWDVIAAVVMPDHVHVLATPLGKGDGAYDLAEILHSVKSFSAHQISKPNRRTGPVWLDKTYDRIVRNEAELEEWYDYIRNNPIRAGLVQTTTDYPWLIDQERP